MSGTTIQSVPLFVDTEVWDRAGLNFESPEIRVLSELVSQGRFRLLVTAITQRELNSHLKKAGAEVKSKLEQLQRALRPFRADITPLSGIVESAIDQDWSQLLLDQFSDRFDDLGLEVIECNGVPLDVILTQYFDNRPPFGSGNKKAEFPDAIAAESLERWAIAEDCEVCVVTSDGDWRQRCEASTRLRHFETLKSAFDHFTDENLSLLIGNGIRIQEPEIRNIVSEKIRDRGTVLDDLDGEVEDPEMTGFDIIEVHLSLIDGNRFVALVDCDIEAEAHATYDDPGSFFWDSEDHCAYHESTSGTATAAFSDTIEIGGTFDLSKPDSVTIDSIWLSIRDIEFSVANP